MAAIESPGLPSFESTAAASEERLEGMSIIREAREMRDEITRLSNLLDWYIKRVDWLEKQLASAPEVLKIIGRRTEAAG